VNSTDGADCGSLGLRDSTQWRDLVGPMRWPRFRGPTKTGGGHCRQPLVRPLGGQPTEYTRQTVVETMPYAEDPCRAHPREIRTEVQHFEVSVQEAGQRLDNTFRSAWGAARSRVYRVIRKARCV